MDIITAGKGSLWIIEYKTKQGLPCNDLYCPRCNIGILGKRSNCSWTGLLESNEIIGCLNPGNLMSMLSDDFKVEREIFVIDKSKPIMKLDERTANQNPGAYYQKILATTLCGNSKICWINEEDCKHLKRLTNGKQS